MLVIFLSFTLWVTLVLLFIELLVNVFVQMSMNTHSITCHDFLQIKLLRHLIYTCNIVHRWTVVKTYGTLCLSKSCSKGKTRLVADNMGYLLCTNSDS